MRKLRLLPGISSVIAVVFITGELFNCCRLNEALALQAKWLVTGLGILKPSKSVPTPNPQDDHPGCHGHVAEPQSESDVQNVSAFGQHGKCISELSITKKSMIGSDWVTLETFAAPYANFEETISVKIPLLERPRPQNRSSPPLYLLTRQLLV